MHRSRVTAVLVAALIVVAFALSGLVGPLQVRADTVTVNISGYSFQPPSMTIPMGTTVTWVNHDAVTHTATSDSGVFDTGGISPGGSASFTFNQAGTFSYHCAIHPYMHGTILVEQAAASPTDTSVPATVAATAAPTAAPTATSIPLAAIPIGSLGGLHLGAGRATLRPEWQGYYDGHKDAYVAGDVSNKAQARSMHINFASSLAHARPLSPMYFVKGRAANRQLAVFGSEPGKSDYSPLWQEVIVQWKNSAKPVLLIRDDQIKGLAKTGKLTMAMTHIVFNAPIVVPGS
ncbi:MAG: cupredoxin domain-containing protein [Chloroflexota bacterium]